MNLVVTVDNKPRFQSKVLKPQEEHLPEVIVTQPSPMHTLEENASRPCSAGRNASKPCIAEGNASRPCGGEGVICPARSKFNIDILYFH